jgi:pSer/pThr/pTyr-binding forkhead associated (FHA) protein
VGNETQAFLRYGADQKFHLSPGRLCQIGRSLANEVVVQDAEVSRHHASVEVRDTEFILSDAGSRNGTYLNGSRIQGAVPLKPGDRIEVGNTKIVFEWPAANKPKFDEDATIATTLSAPEHFTVVLTMNGFHRIAENADSSRLDSALAVCREQVEQILQRDRVGRGRFAGDLVILEVGEHAAADPKPLLDRVLGAASDIAIALEQLPAHASVIGRIQVSGGVWMRDDGLAADSGEALKRAIDLASHASKMGAALQLNELAAAKLRSHYPETAMMLVQPAAGDANSAMIQFFQLQQIVQG